MKRRNLLAIGSSILGGGAIIGTGAVSESTVDREGNITVSGDRDAAYLGLSSPANSIDKLANEFNNTPSDFLINVENRMGVDLENLRFRQLKGDVVTNVLQTQGRNLPAGGVESFQVEVTCTSKDPTLEYAVSVGEKGSSDDAPNDNDVSIDAARSLSLASPENIVSKGKSGAENDDHIFRVFPSEFSQHDATQIEVTYPTDFNLNEATLDFVSVRAGDNTARPDGNQLTFDSTSGSDNPNTNQLTIDMSLTDLKFKNNRVVQVEYGSVDNPDPIGGNVDVKLTGELNDSGSKAEVRTVSF